jgi:hypothetical protein
MARAVADVQTELDAFYALRLSAAKNGGFAEYALDDGQGRQSGKMFSLSEINATITSLESDLRDAQDEAAGYAPGVVSYTGRRY